LKNRKAGETVNIGRIGSSVGLRGEVRVNLYSPDSVNLKEGKVLLLKHAGKEIKAVCKNVRLQNNKPVIRVEGFDDRTAADTLRDMEVYIYAEDLEELPEGEHYVRDLIGYKVVDIADGGGEIGNLRDVIQNTAQSILDVETPSGKTILIPAVDAFLRKIDDENEVIEVELIPGFTEQ
jgi:16S rRNA processing protein RimM